MSNVFYITAGIVSDDSGNLPSPANTFYLSAGFAPDDLAGGVLVAPTLTSPAQFSTQSQPITLEWQAVSGATKYQVQVAEDDLFTTPVVDEIITGGTTLGVDGLSDNSEHFWRVRAGDDN